MAETRPGALHVTDLGRGESVVLVHGSFEWGEKAWSEQRPLAEDYRLRLLDRRGFGRSPDGGRVDFERDADDIAALLDGGAHLVGHSYGGIGCLLAAARRPDAVRSLTVIEPPALGLVRGQDAVEEIIERVRMSRDRARSAAEVTMLFRVAFGYPWKEPPPLEGLELRAAEASFHERPPQEADIPLADLRAAPSPHWSSAAPGAKRRRMRGALRHARSTRPATCSSASSAQRLRSSTARRTARRR